MKKKAKKARVSEPLRLYLTYDEHRSGGERINPEEQWSNRTPGNIEIKFHAFYRETPAHRFFYDSVEVDEKVFNCDRAYLAVVRYSTGDTFGYTDGAWHIVGVAPTHKEADLMLQEALDSEESYKPWEGYFERFDRTEVYDLVIED